MRRGHGVFWGVLGLALVGCEEPSQIVTTAPPGVIRDRTPESEKGDKAPQALGEQAKARPDEKPAAATPDDKIAPAKPTEKGQTVTTPNGLKYETLKEGTGDEVQAGQTVVVKYVGTLDDGKVFDQSKEGQPFTTAVGVVESERKVIKGWNEGMVGMRVGERRKLIVPSDLAYGESGSPPAIPPKARLTFEVELLEIKSAK